MDTLPDPGRATSLDELVDRLRLLKIWAGDLSYDAITARVNAGRPAADAARRSTVANCFQPGRRRLNHDLVLAVVTALHPDVEYVDRWRQALRVIGAETEAVAQVRVQDALPPELDGFTGRAGALAQLSEADSLAVIEGMAGVGKTQLAVHAGHELLRAGAADRVLFVNLRGFHPDPTQPPADPAAVLDGFLRLLGVPGQQIPHDPEARAAAYQERLAGTRTLVVLDNAASADQVRPLLPDVAGCLTLVTSRRSLTDLKPATQLTLDAFTPAEALAFLSHSVGVADPESAARIAQRCGNLPLALSLIAGHIRSTPGWTLADHADRLDERARDRRLDSGVELALALSYQHLPDEQRRLLRLVALHPGQDFDVYAVTALAGAGTPPRLDDLCADHLLQQPGPGRYTFHDLVRAYAAARAQDEDRPADRRDALTRLFDHYLTAATTAMHTLHPTEAPAAGEPMPELTDPGAAAAWLDTERLTLVAMAAHTAANGWPGHTTRLARTLYRHLQGGYNAEALTVHGHALTAARTLADREAEANALAAIGVAHLQMGRTDTGVHIVRQALEVYRQIGDRTGQAFALRNLGGAAERQGRAAEAIDHWREALALCREAGDRTGEATSLAVLGDAFERAGRFEEAIDHCEQALTLARQTGNKHREAFTLNSLGMAETRAGHYAPAGEHLNAALALFGEVGVRFGEAMVLDTLGLLHTGLNRPDEAVDYHSRSLAIVRELGGQDGEVYVLNGLGAALLAAGRPAEAQTHHTEAYAIATALGITSQQATAQAGLGHALRALGNAAGSRKHYEQALTLYTELGLPEAEEIRTLLNPPS
ncbi:tetratricopeptide repeat protein [Actinoplanes sp. NPDC026619]|uniref:ATP-binding protein n=1 Tax=Actinoplanes sp. NPDC026619 TaxID=3155798 RepID=UPI0033D3EDC7